MLGFLLLFAVGVGAYVITDDSDSGQSGEDEQEDDFFTENEVPTTTPVPMTAIQTEVTGDAGEDGVFSTDILPAFENLVEQGLFTQEEFEARLATMTQVDGPMNVSTFGGNDFIYGSAGADTIDAGDDDDFVVGGDGDDYIDLGDGRDWVGDAGRIYEDEFDDAYTSILGPQDGGDDEIYGRKGDDWIVDFIGSNTLSGNEGNDYILSLDAETDGTLSPDKVFGGWGEDSLRVDEGDTVTTGVGADSVTIDVDFAGEVDNDYEPVVITDFVLGQDALSLTGSSTALNSDVTDGGITVTDLQDNAGSSISLNGIEIARVLGVEGMTNADIFVSSSR